MRRIASAVLPFALIAGVVAPIAAAEELHANVVSWSPNDVKPGEPVAVVLELYTRGPSPYPKDGDPVAGVNDVEVVIYGERQTRRFTTDDVGGGRYGTEIVIPEAGDWDLRVRYGAGSYGPGHEILLGKGAICVGAELCISEQPAQTDADAGNGRPWMVLALAVGVVLTVALIAAALIRFAAVGRRRSTSLESTTGGSAV